MDSAMETSPAEMVQAADAGRTARPNRGQRAGENLKSVLIGVHCTPALVAQIERFIAGLEYDEMSKPEAIRLILKRYFREHGYE